MKRTLVVVVFMLLTAVMVAQGPPPPMPTHLRVGPFTYTIEVRPGDKMGDDASGRYLGKTLYQTQEIWIREGLAFDSTAETLLHESLHAAAFNAGIENEEAFVRGTSPFLLQVLRDNPELVKFLTWKKGN